MNDRTWRKSSYSTGQGNCVEVSTSDAGTMVRDSKANGEGPELAFTPDEWRAFINGAKDGEFDL